MPLGSFPPLAPCADLWSSSLFVLVTIIPNQLLDPSRCKHPSAYANTLLVGLAIHTAAIDPVRYFELEVLRVTVAR